MQRAVGSIGSCGPASIRKRAAARDSPVNLAALTIEQRVEAPYDARVDLRVEEPLTALRLDGEVAFTVQPAAFGIEQAPAETVGSTLSLRGTLDALDLTGRVELQGGASRRHRSADLGPATRAMRPKSARSTSSMPDRAPRFTPRAA